MVESQWALWHRSYMREPDLTLHGLSIWVLGRAHPEASDYWDGNWLTLRAAVQVGESLISIHGPLFMTTDIARFRSELAAMHQSLTGEATLAGYEPNLKVTLRTRTLGHVSCQVEITPDQMTEYHRFDFELDQTYLAKLMTSCEAVTQRFPVIGQPDD